MPGTISIRPHYSAGAPPLAAPNVSSGSAEDAAVRRAIAGFFGGAVVPARSASGSNRPAAGDEEETPEPQEEMAPEDKIAALEQELGHYRAYAPILQQLHQAGYHDADSVHAAIASRSHDQNIGQIQQQIMAHLQDAVNSGEMTPEQAAATYHREAHLMQREVAAEQVLRQNHSQQIGQRLAAIVQNHPELAIGRPADGSGPGVGEALVRSLHAAGYGELPHLAAYIADYVRNAQQAAISDHLARQQQAQGIPMPMRSGGGAPPATQGERGMHRAPWSRLLGIRTA